MEQMKCPGQDTRFWKPDDIFVAECPKCGAEIEFFKDDARRRCAWCGHMFYNPKIELGCAEWCQYAEKCVPDLVKAKKRPRTLKTCSQRWPSPIWKETRRPGTARPKAWPTPRTCSRPKGATPRWSWQPCCSTGWRRIRPGSFWRNWKRSRRSSRPWPELLAGQGAERDLNRQIFQDVLALLEEKTGPTRQFATRTAQRLAAAAGSEK